MTVFYFYLAPLSRLWSNATREHVTEIETGQWQEPARALATEGATAAG
jgi:hypothetical protein